MRLKRHVPLLDSTLKHAILRPAAPSLCNRCRRYASSAAYPKEVAVLGGGISGLSTAYFLTKEFPNSKITIYEAAKDGGGWIQSRRVGVPGGDVLFEYGPRTLRRVGGHATGHLVQELDLVDSVVYTQQDAPGAMNRFIYYPDRLNCIPSRPNGLGLLDFLSCAQSGLLAGALSVLFERNKPPRPHYLQDESIGSFIARRADKRIADNLVSAVFHGIYAGDIWKLSAKSLLEYLWYMEGKSGSITKHQLMRQNTDGPPQTEMNLWDAKVYERLLNELHPNPEFIEKLSTSALYTFKNGMGQLVQRLKSQLAKDPNVEFRFDSPVQKYSMAQGNQKQVEVVAGSPEKSSTSTYDLVFSSLRDPSLTPYVTVMTVNLYYRNPSLLRRPGFGYLLPQSVPFEQNPNRALGVIFDSEAITGQDSVPGTKLTVMLGGHYWDGWTHFPTQSEGLDMAMSVVRQHLGITDNPEASHVNLSRDCIPQYTVGYNQRLRNKAMKIQEEFKGAVRIVGNQVHGVGVNDCIRGAWDVVTRCRAMGWKSDSTGLERAFLDQWGLVTPVLASQVDREDE